MAERSKAAAKIPEPTAAQVAWVESVSAECRPLINGSPGLLSLLYDVDLLPEQLSHVLRHNPGAARVNGLRMMAICNLWRVAYPGPTTPAVEPGSEGRG